MGLKFNIKKAIVQRSINKRKKNARFDIEYSDNFVIPENAESSFNNSHYFSMHDPASCQSLYMRLAKRGGSAMDEVWLVYRDKSGKVYFAEKDHYEKGEKLPCEVLVSEAGKLLKFSFRGHLTEAEFGDGDCKAAKDSKKVYAEIEAEFYGTAEPYEFSIHSPAEPMARALAAEKWTKQFLAALKDNHQFHYEQRGRISGSIKLDGETTEFKDISAVRDHSYGKRDWDYFDRHIWILGLLENGDLIHCSFTRYPAVKQISAGFYISDKGTEHLKSLCAMEDMPCDGGVAKKFGFSAEFYGGRKCTLNINREFSVRFGFGGGMYFINEGVSSFDVNGVKGRGITEFGYNADSKRWKR